MVAGDTHHKKSGATNNADQDEALNVNINRANRNAFNIKESIRYYKLANTIK